MCLMSTREIESTSTCVLFKEMIVIITTKPWAENAKQSVVSQMMTRGHTDEEQRSARSFLILTLRSTGWTTVSLNYTFYSFIKGQMKVNRME